jgi:hypothetical protein
MVAILRKHIRSLEATVCQTAKQPGARREIILSGYMVKGD